MRVSVVVPLAGDCPYRARAWAWLRPRFAGWDVIEARAPASTAWRKGGAVNPALAACESDVVVLSDADVWCEELAAAVAAVAAGAPWAVPHRDIHRLSAAGTEAVLRGDYWRAQDLAQPPYRGLLGGGIVVAPLEVLLSVPIDNRFAGWGQEDECHARALCALVGQPWRGEADLVHLWHPPQPRLSRRRGSPASWALRGRYHQARNDPCAMRALIEEGRDACPADQPAVHDHA
jgi:hypothetical protein